jgi:hypothetical protein
MRIAVLRSKVSGRIDSGGIALPIGPSRDSRAADLTGPTGVHQTGIARPLLAGRSQAVTGSNQREGATAVQRDAMRRGVVRARRVARLLMATAITASGAGMSIQIPIARAGPGLRNSEPEEAVSRMISAIFGNGILPSFISGRACILDSH